MARALVKGLSDSEQNYLINGDFKINQRGGTSGSAADQTYYLDRWGANVTTVTATYNRLTTNQPTGLVGTTSFRLTAQSTVTGYLNIYQKIEDFNFLAGKTITVSCWVKAVFTSGPSTFRIRIGDGVNDSIFNPGYTTNNVWQFVQVTTTLTTAPTGLSFMFGAFNTSLTSGDLVEITNAMVTVGTGVNSSRFILAAGSSGGELEMCRRYFRVIGSSSINGNPVGIIGGTGSGTTQLLWYVQGAEGMRITTPVLASVGTITMRTAGGATITGAPTTLNLTLSAGYGFQTNGLSGVVDSAWYYIENSGGSTCTLTAEL